MVPRIAVIAACSFLLLVGCQEVQPLLPGSSSPSPTSRPSAGQILGIAINPRHLELNAPSSNGESEARYVVSASVTAQVQATAGTDHPVRWQSLDSTRVTVDDRGLVKAVVDAPLGTALVQVTSVEDERVTATLSVTIAHQSGMDVGVN